MIKMIWHTKIVNIRTYHYSNAGSLGFSKYSLLGILVEKLVSHQRGTIIMEEPPLDYSFWHQHLHSLLS